jgi:hypothetical protein
MKRGFLSQEEKDYIEQNRTRPVAELAKDLDRSENAVQKHLGETEVEKPKTAFDKLVGKHKGGVIMNQGASSIVDDNKRGKRIPSKLNGAIHRIK